MILNRREFNKQETMRHIRSVFMELYAEGGIDGITINSLCKACGIAKSTFYLYYEDKYQVLEAVETDLLAGLRDASFPLQSCGREAILHLKTVEAAKIFVRFLLLHADTLRALLGKYGDPRFSYKWKKGIHDAFLDRFRAEKGNTPSADIACTIFSSSLIGLYTLYIFDAPNVTEDEFALVIGNLVKFSLFDFEAFAGNS